jgi:hypothetical protein
VDSVSELNKQKVRLFVEAVWNEGRLELIDELVADDYVGHKVCAGWCQASAALIPICTSRSMTRSPRTTES